MRCFRMFVCLLFPLIALLIVGLTTNGVISDIVHSFGAFIGSVSAALFHLVLSALNVVWLMVRLILPFFAAGAVGIMAHDLHKGESGRTGVRDAICVSVAGLSILAALFVSGYTLLFSASLIFGIWTYFSLKGEMKKRKISRPKSYPLLMFFLGSTVCFVVSFLCIVIFEELSGQANRDRLDEISRIYAQGSEDERRSMDETLRAAIEKDPRRAMMRTWFMDEALTAKNISTSPDALKIPFEYDKRGHILTCTRKNGEIQSWSGPASYTTRAVQTRLCAKRSDEF